MPKLVLESKPRHFYLICILLSIAFSFPLWLERGRIIIFPTLFMLILSSSVLLTSIHRVRIYENRLEVSYLGIFSRQILFDDISSIEIMPIYGDTLIFKDLGIQIYSRENLHYSAGAILWWTSNGHEIAKEFLKRVQVVNYTVKISSLIRSRYEK